MDTTNQCEFCNKNYKNKYTLKTHLAKGKCSKEIASHEFTCEGCNELFDRKYNFERHLTVCIIYQKVTICKQTYENLLTILQEENTILKQKLDECRAECETTIKIKEASYQSHLASQNKQIDTLNTIIKETLSDSVKKSTTTVNQNTQHISYRDCLSKDHTVDQLNEKHLVERLRISMTESMFFGGLRDIARLCYDCIVKLKSGKMILCCTDVSRGKFKMYDLHGNIKEDIEARYFTEKVGKCIRVAANDIYKCIVDSIQDEQSMLTETDFKRKEELIDKYKRTCDAYIEIINVDDPGRNSEFINELAALTSVNAIVTPLCPNINSKRSIHDLL